MSKVMNFVYTIQPEELSLLVKKCGGDVNKVGVEFSNGFRFRLVGLGMQCYGRTRSSGRVRIETPYAVTGPIRRATCRTRSSGRVRIETETQRLGSFGMLRRA
jgi:hypothetical protein